MKATQKQIEEIAQRFEDSILDGLREQAKANNGSLAINAETLKAAAFPAIREACESVFDAEGKPVELSANQVAVIWESCMKINVSAFAQHCERLEEAKTLGFAIAGKAKKARGIALQYAQ